MNEYEQVKAFVAKTWDGQYVTGRCRDMPGYVRCWETKLHGPDGDLVFTGVRDDGTLVDLTR